MKRGSAGTFLISYLELSQVDIQCTIKAQWSSDGRHYLTNQTVKVGVSWSFYVQVTATDVINSFIIHHKGTVRMFQGGVSGQNGVVRFNHCRWNLWCRVDRELQFGFLAIVNRQTFHEQRCEARTSTSTKRVEDKESLQSCALVSLGYTCTENQNCQIRLVFFSVICFELFALSLKPPFILFVLHVLYQIACKRKWVSWTFHISILSLVYRFLLSLHWMSWMVMNDQR